MEKRYLLYMKAENQKRFSAVDWKNGSQVGNLIFATRFTKDNADKVLEEAQRLNPEYQFKIKEAR